MENKGFNMGQTIGLVHNNVCKSSYRAWSKDPSPANKEKMIQGKKDCPLCDFKKQIRSDAKKAVTA